MSHVGHSAADLVAMIQESAPEFLDLLTAETDDQFNQAFYPLLERAITHLEQNKLHFVDLGEEGLSAVIVGDLSMPGLSVSQERHSNGHVDITIEVEHSTPARRKLGEAKIYNGPAYHVKGLVQLLGRYTTGRESRGLLIVYCRNKDIAGKVRALRSHMDLTRPCEQQGQTVDHPLKWSFLSNHSHSSGEMLEVEHVGCNLCTDQ